MKGFWIFLVRWSGVLSIACIAWFVFGSALGERNKPSLLPIYLFGAFYTVWLAKVIAHTWERARSWRYGWLARGYILLFSIPGFPITLLGILLWHKILKFDYQSGPEISDID